MEATFTSMEAYNEAITNGDDFSADVIEGNMFAGAVLENLKKGTIDNYLDILGNISEGNKKAENLMGAPITEDQKEESLCYAY